LGEKKDEEGELGVFTARKMGREPKNESKRAMEYQAGIS